MSQFIKGGGGKICLLLSQYFMSLRQLKVKVHKMLKHLKYTERVVGQWCSNFPLTSSDSEQEQCLK